MYNIHGLVGSGVAALIRGDIGIARLRGNFFSLPFQDEIDGRDFIFGLDGVVGDMVMATMNSDMVGPPVMREMRGFNP